MPKNKKAQSTVKDLMIIAIFIFSLSALILSVFAVHTVKNYDEKISSYNNANAINGYSLFKISDIIDRMIHGKEHSVNEENNNNEEMFHPREYKYNGPLTQQQVVEQTPAYHILKDIYTIINGKYYPISTKEGYINGSFINYSSNINLHNHNINDVNEINANELSSKKICLNGVCRSNWSSALGSNSFATSATQSGNVYSAAVDEIESYVRGCIGWGSGCTPGCEGGVPCSHSKTKYFEIEAEQNIKNLNVSAKIQLTLHKEDYSFSVAKAYVICYKNGEVVFNFTKTLKNKKNSPSTQTITRIYDPYVLINLSKGDTLKCEYHTYAYSNTYNGGVSSADSKIDIEASYSKDLFKCVSGNCASHSKIMYVNCNWVPVKNGLGICPQNTVNVGVHLYCDMGICSVDKLLCCELRIPG